MAVNLEASEAEAKRKLQRHTEAEAAWAAISDDDQILKGDRIASLVQIMQVAVQHSRRRGPLPAPQHLPQTPRAPWLATVQANLHNSFWEGVASKPSFACSLF